MRRNSGGIWERFEKYAGKTFEEAASRYLKEFDGKDKRGPALSLESTLPYIGRLKLIDVDDEALQPFKEDRLLGRGPFAKTDKNGNVKLAPAMAGTVNKELTQVSTVLHKAARVWRWLPMAPLIQHVTGATRMAYPLTWEEQDKLFRKLPSGWAMGAALFAVNTGVRRAELFGLKWTDLVPIPHLDTFVFVLHGDNTKNGKSRAVICNSLAMKAVDHERGNGSPFVFPSKAPGTAGQKISQESSVWLRAWAAAKLPGDKLIRKGIHNLRHTFAHRLRAAGVPEEDRNALLGHANVNLAQHYAMPDIERLLVHAEKITERRETVVLRAIKSSLGHSLASESPLETSA